MSWTYLSALQTNAARNRSHSKRGHQSVSGLISEMESYSVTPSAKPTFSNYTCSLAADLSFEDKSYSHKHLPDAYSKWKCRSSELDANISSRCTILYSTGAGLRPHTISSFLNHCSCYDMMIIWKCISQFKLTS